MWKNANNATWEGPPIILAVTERQFSAQSDVFSESCSWASILLLVGLFFFQFAGNVRAAEPSMDDRVKKLGTGSGYEEIEALNAIYASTNEAIPALIRGLRNPDSQVRARSVRLIKEFGSKDAAAEIVRLSQSDPNWIVRDEAIGALRCIKHPDALQLLKRLAGDRALHGFNRINAMRGISKSEGSAAIPFVKELLRDPDPLVAASASHELAKLGDNSGLEVAEKALIPSGLGANQLNAQSEAIHAVYILAEKYPQQVRSLLPVIEEIAKNRKYGNTQEAIRAIEHVKLQDIGHEQRLPRLSEGLKSDSKSIRVWASWELAELGNEDALAILRAAANDHDRPGQIQAANALIHLEQEKNSSCR